MRPVPLAILLVLLTAPASFAAGGLTPIAVGEWSDWHDHVRARLIFCKGRATVEPELRESLVFVEIERDLSEQPESSTFKFDPARVACALRDAQGRAVAQRLIIEETQASRERRKPAATLVTLPDAAKLRLRVSPYCACETPDVGLLIPLHDKEWLIKADDKAAYYLSATLTLLPPTEREANGADVALTPIKLPKLKLTSSMVREAK